MGLCRKCSLFSSNVNKQITIYSQDKDLKHIMHPSILLWEKWQCSLMKALKIDFDFVDIWHVYLLLCWTSRWLTVFYHCKPFSLMPACRFVSFCALRIRVYLLFNLPKYPAWWACHFVHAYVIIAVVSWHILEPPCSTLSYFLKLYGNFFTKLIRVTLLNKSI